MKTINQIFIGIIFICLLGCEASITPKKHIISIAIDQTESTGNIISSDFILAPLQSSHLSDGIELSLFSISDIRYNSKVSFVLDIGDVGWLANDDTRRTQRKLLFQRFKDSLEQVNSIQQDLNKSEIFRVVAKELNLLALKKGKRSLIISSDLKEHSFFSVYNSKDLYQLFNNPKSVQSIFESQGQLASDLSGITVVIVYKPTLEDDELFSRLIQLYRAILEARGATVKVGINNRIKI